MSLVPAVGYARASTKKQDTSVADQIKAIQKFAAEKCYHLTKIYADDAISGDETDDRVQFLQMVEDAKLKQFKAILVWDQPRFGRFDSLEGSHYSFLFRQAGVSLVTLDKGLVDWNTFVGILNNTIEQYAAHEHLLKVSRGVVRKHLELAKVGSWLGSAPYGYVVEGKKYDKYLEVEDINKIKIVQRIFNDFVSKRMSMRAIATRLNVEGVVSPSGLIGGWRFDTVRVILANPAYTGVVASKRSAYGKYFSMNRGTEDQVPIGSRRENVPEENWIINIGKHEPVISADLFSQAKELLAKNKVGRPKWYCEGTSNPYLFTCMLKCGKCGGLLYGGKSGRFKYYICGNSHYNGPDHCEGTSVREDLVLRTIVNYLDQEWLSLDGNALAWKADRKEITSPDDLPEAYSKLREIVAPPTTPKQTEADRARLEKKVKELTGKINRARANLFALEDLENVKAGEELIRGLTAQQEEIKAELNREPAAEADINADTMEILRSLYWLSILLRSAADELQEPDPEIRGEQAEGAIFVGASTTPALREFLNKISAITIHSTITGTATRRRHTLTGGEILFHPIRVPTGKGSIIHTGWRRNRTSSPGDQYS